MQKTARAVTEKPTRANANGRPRAAGAKPAAAHAPDVSKVTGDTVVTAPPGCRASVLLKLVERDEGHRYYEWWLVVGRHGAEAASAKYKADGADVIRIDVPDGMPMTAEAFQPHLEAYFARAGVEPPDTPTVRD